MSLQYYYKTYLFLPNLNDNTKIMVSEKSHCDKYYIKLDTFPFICS